MRARSTSVALSLAVAGRAHAQDWPDRTTLRIPLAPFEGTIGETYQEVRAGLT